MSIDYPKRNDWLTKRYTPENLWRTRGRLIWNSDRGGNYVRAKHGPIGEERVRGR